MQAGRGIFLLIIIFPSRLWTSLPVSEFSKSHHGVKSFQKDLKIVHPMWSIDFFFAKEKIIKEPLNLKTSLRDEYFIEVRDDERNV